MEPQRWREIFDRAAFLEGRSVYGATYYQQ
jgi:hypothetical protein